MAHAAEEHGSTMVPRLVGRYALEADLYREILDLARQQGEILRATRDVDRCTALFERKDEHFRTIAAIEEEIAPLTRRWWTADVGPEDRRRLNDLLDEILGLIEAVMAEEQRNEQILAQCEREVHEQLGQLHRRPALGAAERHDADLLPRFMDIRR